MKRLPLLALVLVSLVMPATTLADEPALNRAWQVTAITMGGTRTAISGKLSITNGMNLGASAGCNSIGAQVKLDGDVVVIVGPAYMTEMACPGINGQAEELLLKILGAGRFTITSDKWTSDIGDIEVTEVSAPDPGPPGVPPDQPVVGGGKVDPGTTAIGEPEFAVDTARDVLFVPLAIGFGILVVVTIVLLLRGPRAAKPDPTDLP